jgi:4-amino-4-deoxy-L-arabinose transferase-like glycosyltransferase
MRTMKKNNLIEIVTNPYLILVILSIIFVFNSLNPVVSYDENLWSYMGNLWAKHGIPPYTGAVENKTPAIFFLYATANFLTAESIFVIRILGVFATLLSAFILYCICEKLHSKRAGIFCMLIFGLSMSWRLVDGSYFAHTEVFMVLFSVLAFYFIIKAKSSSKMKYDLFFAGISIGIAISFKQIAVTTLVAVVLFFLVFSANHLSIKKKILGISLFFLGVTLSISLSILILFIYGVSFLDYIEGAWLILFNSGSKVSSFEIQIAHFFDKLIGSRFVFFYFFVFLFFYQKKLVNKPLFYGILLWFVFDFIGVNASGYYYGHQIKQVIPSLSLMGGMVMGNLMAPNFYLKRKNLNPLWYFIILTFLFFPYKQCYRTLNLLLNPPDSFSKNMGYWVKEHTFKNDYIYILGDDDNLISALAASSRVSSSNYFNLIFIKEDKHRHKVYSDLMNNTPKIILKIENDSLQIKEAYGEKVDEFFKSNYTLFTVKEGFEVYKYH